MGDRTMSKIELPARKEREWRGRIPLPRSWMEPPEMPEIEDDRNPFIDENGNIHIGTPVAAPDDAEGELLEHIVLDKMDKPKVCVDKECGCIWHDHTETFCIGGIPERLDIINGKEHRNDFQFCIITELRGHNKCLFNKSDMDLVAKAMLAGIATCNDQLNLHWYLENHQFHMEGDTIVLDK